MEFGFVGPLDLPTEAFHSELQPAAKFIREARETGAKEFSDILLYLIQTSDPGPAQDLLRAQIADIGQEPPRPPAQLEKSTEIVRMYALEKRRSFLTWELNRATDRGEVTTGIHRQLAELDGEGVTVDVPSVFPAFYDGTRFFLDNGKDFVPMDSRSIKAQVKLRGLEGIEEIVCRIQTEKFIKYHGPLAGKMRGVYESNGDLLLASTGPKIIRSRPGEFPIIRQFIEDLFGGDGHAETQVDAFLGWMKTARLAMLAGKRRPGQALVLAGPIACGKTQLIKQVIIPAMGGRDAKPYKFLSGKTGFNSDLLGAEVLVIDDEAASTRIEQRRALGDGIKTSLFASSVRIEGKFKQGFDYAPLWRIVIAVNDQPEALLVLPPLSHDLADKLMILKCQKALELADDDFEIWQATIAGELPAFLHAVERFEIEPGNADGRCGVRSFYHPDVVDAISELSPEHQLWSLIAAMESAGGISLPWEGTSAALKALLTSQSSAVRMDADRLLGSWPAACGVYLARLVGKGIEKLPLRDGDQRWRVSKSGEVDTKSN